MNHNKHRLPGCTPARGSPHFQVILKDLWPSWNIGQLYTGIASRYLFEGHAQVFPWNHVHPTPSRKLVCIYIYTLRNLFEGILIWGINPMAQPSSQRFFKTFSSTTRCQNTTGTIEAKHVFFIIILLMEEILHHLGCKKPCTLNDGINYLSTGAGFLPSTVFVVAKNFGWSLFGARNHFIGCVFFWFPLWHGKKDLERSLGWVFPSSAAVECATSMRIALKKNT